MNKLLAIFLSVILVSCNNETDSKKQTTDDTTTLTGEWNNVSMRVEINSKNNSDSNEVLNVEKSEWEARLKIRPIRTFFRADSTWNSAHYNLKDSLVYNPSGKWWISGDSLVMAQTFPSPDTTLYLLQLKNDTASFEANLDWDMDGKRDDRYFGRQNKVRTQ